MFAKCAHEEVVAGFLRTEHAFYAAVEGDFMPRFVAFIADDPPVLVLEDLSDGHWPPPWRPGDVEAVVETLSRVHAAPPPEDVPPVETDREELAGGWAAIERAPAPFLSLGLCEPPWLEQALPDLRRAAETAPIAGDALLHLDVRSDNICLADRGAVLVDWNWAHVGNPDLDVAAWLPSLHLEGGPSPETVLPGAGGFAALLAGFFGSRAGLLPPPTAPFVREIQLAQLRVALPWAAGELGLPPPGG